MVQTLKITYSFSKVILHIFFTCDPYSDYQISVTCSYDGFSTASNLTIEQPLSSGSLYVQVNCEGVTEAWPKIQVQGKKKSKPQFCKY